VFVCVCVCVCVCTRVCMCAVYHHTCIPNPHVFMLPNTLISPHFNSSTRLLYTHNYACCTCSPLSLYFTHTHTHTHTHIHIHTHVRARTHTHIHTHTLTEYTYAAFCLLTSYRYLPSTLKLSTHTGTGFHTNTHSPQQPNTPLCCLSSSISANHSQTNHLY